MTKEEILEKASDFEDEDEFVKCNRLPFIEEWWLCISACLVPIQVVVI